MPYPNKCANEMPESIIKAPPSISFFNCITVGGFLQGKKVQVKAADIFLRFLQKYVESRE